MYYYKKICIKAQQVRLPPELEHWSVLSVNWTMLALLRP